MRGWPAASAKNRFLQLLGAPLPSAHWASARAPGPSRCAQATGKITGGINTENTTLLFHSSPLSGNTHAQQRKD